MDKQRTIAKELGLRGVGLHTANKVGLTFKPAEIDSGITFIRTDMAGKPKVKVSVESLLPTERSPRRTSIGHDTVEIQTIEHLMAALAGLSIDNLNIEIDNNEVPGLDGSSLNFLEIITRAGIIEQNKERRYFKIKEPIFIEEDGASIMMFPSSELKVSYVLDYKHTFLKAQFLEIEVNPRTFQDELAKARTFCLEEEAQELQHQGFGQGANYENTLVVGKNGVIKNTLRYEDEFARHKVLDLLGDLYLLGQPIKGRIVALRSGHSLNLKLAGKISKQIRRYSLSGVGASHHPQDGQELDRLEVMKILPHRDPFLFVDKIIHLDKGKRAIGIKKVTKDEYFFKGHFPGRPVMPGVLIIEAMAQVGGVMMLSSEETRGKLAFFMAADNIKFRKTVLPGDTLVLDVTAGKIRTKTGQVHAKAFVDDKLVTEADFMFALADS